MLCLVNPTDYNISVPTSLAYFILVKATRKKHHDSRHLGVFMPQGKGVLTPRGVSTKGLQGIGALSLRGEGALGAGHLDARG